MKIVFSRKGFDSAAGGGPSPIVKGRTLSLPIPDTQKISRTTYGNLGLGGHAKRASRGRFSARHLCHNDPMFLDDGRAMLGQCGAAQTHLANHGVGRGDLFLFFGLFKGEDGEAHHRIFGYLEVERVVDLASCDAKERDECAALGHPHALGMHAKNDMIYCGRGASGAPAIGELRLTEPGANPSLWRLPRWVEEVGLSYHAKPERWLGEGRLQSVARGQEFVADIGERADAREWARRVIGLIES